MCSLFAVFSSEIKFKGEIFVCNYAGRSVDTKSTKVAFPFPGCNKRIPLSVSKRI